MGFLKRNAAKLITTIAVVLLVTLLSVSGFAVWKIFFYNEPEPVDSGETYTLTNADIALFQAVRDGDADEVLRCLNEGGSVHAMGEYGTTPFKIAIALGRADVVLEFIQAGHADASEESLLVYAIVQNRPQIVKELVKVSPNVDLPDNNGYTPLLYAIDRNNVTAAKELLNAGADVNAQGKEKISPLIAAVRRGKPDMVAELLKAGADWKIPSPSGETAISIARKRKHLEVIAALLAEAEAPAETMTYEYYMDYTLSDEGVDSEEESISA